MRRILSITMIPCCFAVPLYAQVDQAQEIAEGIVWLDETDNWDTTIGNGNPAGTFDFAPVMAHELGHAYHSAVMRDLRSCIN